MTYSLIATNNTSVCGEIFQHAKHITMHVVLITSIFFNNSELLDNHEETFSLYYMDSDASSKFKFSTTHRYMTRHDRGKVLKTS